MVRQPDCKGIASMLRRVTELMLAPLFLIVYIREMLTWLRATTSQHQFETPSKHVL